MNFAVNYGGLKLKNPLIVASGGISKNLELMLRAEEHGAAAIVMKTLFEEEYARKIPTPCFRLIKRKSGPQRSTTFYTFEQASSYDLKGYAKEIREAKKQLSVPVIASINCVNDQTWSEYAVFLEESGASAIELNRSCPYSTVATSGKEMWTALAGETIKRVKDAVSIPVFIKLTPQLSDPSGAAIALEEAGADAVVMFSRFTGLEIDLKSEKPVMHGGLAGHGGLWSIHYALRWISAAYPSLKIAIGGSGGVASGEDVIKFILSGASAVQICTAVYTEGFKIFPRYLATLQSYMAEKGYGSPEEFRGKICEKIVPTPEVERGGNIRAMIDLERCNSCGICLEVCLYDAIDFVNESVCSVNNKCAGCGLCQQLCPRNAILL